LGVLALAFERDQGARADQRDFLDVFARQGALALERARLADEAKHAALRARSEEMRSSLLSAVSHDLRSPLAAITGAATELRDGGTPEGGIRRELLDTICEEAERLERLVSNLLDMTRLDSGTLQVRREWFPLEEVVGSALTRLEAELRGRPIDVAIPSSLPLLAADPVLLEQLFVNLLENASVYTPAGSPIEIRAQASNGLFEKFVRGEHVGIPGAGLGLAICRGIANAHGGELVAENRPGGGAVFRLTLPVPNDPPPADVALDPSASSESAT
jgi:two-component system sensor histidine kinase KdpD